MISQSEKSVFYKIDVQNLKKCQGCMADYNVIHMLMVAKITGAEDFLASKTKWKPEGTEDTDLGEMSRSCLYEGYSPKSW